MFIDIHCHLQKDKGVPRMGLSPFVSPSELLDIFHAEGIDKGVILPIIGPECYEPQSNEEVLQICEKFPEKFIPFCNIHPRAIDNDPKSDFSPLLDYYKERGCKGFGEITANLPMNSPLVENLFSHIEKSGLPTTIHISFKDKNTYGLIDKPGLPGLDKTLERFPDLVILGHSGNFWSEIDDYDYSTVEERGFYPKGKITKEGAVPKLLRKYKNLRGDLSAGSGYNAMARDEEYAIKFLNEFQDQLYYGNDVCTPGSKPQLGQFLKRLRKENKISPTVFNKITHDNGEEIIR